MYVLDNNKTSNQIKSNQSNLNEFSQPIQGYTHALHNTLCSIYLYVSGVHAYTGKS